MKKPVLVLADRYDAYVAWCGMMGMNPRKDALWIRDCQCVYGRRGHKWVMVTRMPLNQFLAEWEMLAKHHKHEFVERKLWFTLSPLKDKVEELEKELDRARRNLLAVVANSEVW